MRYRSDNPRTPHRSGNHVEPERLRDAMPAAVGRAGQVALWPVWFLLRWLRRVMLLVGLLFAAAVVAHPPVSNNTFMIRVFAGLLTLVLVGPWFVARYWRNHSGYLQGPRYCGVCGHGQSNTHHVCDRCGRVLARAAYTTRVAWYRLGPITSTGGGWAKL